MHSIFVLAFAGFLFLAAEVFVPGMLLGFLGTLALVATVVLGYLQFGLVGGSWVFAVVGGCASGAFLIWLKLFPKTVIGRRISNRAAIASSVLEKTPLVGVRGVAISPLRPAGVALIEGKRRDVMTEGTFIEPGAPVVVIAEDGQKLVVRGEISEEFLPSVP